MMLVVRNHVGEFVPGCEHTVVRIDADVVNVIARRAAACRAMCAVDPSSAEVRFWDDRPVCVESPDPEREEHVEHALDRDDGWSVLEDELVGTFGAARIDVTQMVIGAGNPPTVAWAYRVGSEPVRTFDVPLPELGCRLGSPLGNPLLVRP
jgi:hypothetical protein